MYEPGPNCAWYCCCRLSMPCTLADQFPVARKDSRWGRVIWKIARCPFSEPMVSSENGAGCAVW